MTSVKLNSIYYNTIQIHIQVVTLVLHNRSETTPHICRMQSCTPRYEKLGSLPQSDLHPENWNPANGQSYQECFTVPGVFAGVERMREAAGLLSLFSQTWSAQHESQCTNQEQKR